MDSTARVRADGGRLHTGYDPSSEDYGFVRPEVLVDFGARPTGEPHETRMIGCAAATFLPDLSFPEARPPVMPAELTFRGKAASTDVLYLRNRRRAPSLQGMFAPPCPNFTSPKPATGRDRPQVSGQAPRMRTRDHTPNRFYDMEVDDENGDAA